MKLVLLLVFMVGLAWAQQPEPYPMPHAFDHPENLSPKVSDAELRARVHRLETELETAVFEACVHRTTDQQVLQEGVTNLEKRCTQVAGTKFGALVGYLLLGTDRAMNQPAKKKAFCSGSGK